MIQIILGILIILIMMAILKQLKLIRKLLVNQNIELSNIKPVEDKVIVEERGKEETIEMEDEDICPDCGAILSEDCYICSICGTEFEDA